MLPWLFNDAKASKRKLMALSHRNDFYKKTPLSRNMALIIDKL